MSVIEINSSDFKAKINSYGASLVYLSKNGFDLIEPDTKPNLYAGSVLAPWPNRIKDGRYKFNNKIFELPINEVAKNNSLHGLVANSEWQVLSKTQASVELGYYLDSPEIYPGKLKLTTSYILHEDHLEVCIHALNIGQEVAPYGVSIHTYFVTGKKVKNDQLFLQIPSSEFMQVDLERLLPIGLKRVDKVDFDFRVSKQISNLFIDHAFKVDPALPKQVRLLNSSNLGVNLEFDGSTKWFQIHTADRQGGDDSRMAVAIEPMSCPPDAFNSGIDLITLAPAQSHTFTLKIRHD
jgi:aldose 1-epimerase